MAKWIFKPPFGHSTYFSQTINVVDMRYLYDNIRSSSLINAEDKVLALIFVKDDLSQRIYMVACWSFVHRGGSWVL